MKNKNNKLPYYLINIFRFFIPLSWINIDTKKLLYKYSFAEQQYILDRVNYYNKLESHFETNSKEFISIKEFKKLKKKTYFFDLYEYLRFFKLNLKLSCLFGDIIHIPDVPSLLKSRPISDKNQNSILMKLDKIRHFLFIKDNKRFEDKKDMVVFRGAAYWPKRKDVIKKFYNHPLCEFGQTNKPAEDVPWQKPKMSIEEQLDYKFILSIEGNDVATNLKWIMSSNSLVFMIKPVYETWFMEGKLIPNHHYVLLKDDYSDLEEKVNYYSKNINEALDIIHNAQVYIEQFKNKKREDLISFLVLEKYFRLSNQL